MWANEVFPACSAGRFELARGSKIVRTWEAHLPLFARHIKSRGEHDLWHVPGVDVDIGFFLQLKKIYSKSSFEAPTFELDETMPIARPDLFLLRSNSSFLHSARDLIVSPTNLDRSSKKFISRSTIFGGTKWHVLGRAGRAPRPESIIEMRRKKFENYRQRPGSATLRTWSASEPKVIKLYAVSSCRDGAICN